MSTPPLLLYNTWVSSVLQSHLSRNLGFGLPWFYDVSTVWYGTYFGHFERDPCCQYNFNISVEEWASLTSQWCLPEGRRSGPISGPRLGPWRKYCSRNGGRNLVPSHKSLDVLTFYILLLFWWMVKRMRTEYSSSESAISWCKVAKRVRLCSCKIVPIFFECRKSRESSIPPCFPTLYIPIYLILSAICLVSSFSPYHSNPIIHKSPRLLVVLLTSRVVRLSGRLLQTLESEVWHQIRSESRPIYIFRT